MPPLQRSDPYPWPWDAAIDEPLDASRIALLCVAVQPSFTAATVGAEAATVTIGLAARALRQAGAAVLCVTVGARPHPVRPSPLRSEVPEDPDPLIAAYSDAVIASVGIDGFFASPLESLLRDLGRDRVVLCGLGAETAVDSTLRSANDRGFECLTLVDAVAPHSPDVAAHAHSSVTMSGGIFGAIGTTADLLGAIGAAPQLPDADTPTPSAHHPTVAPQEVPTP